MLSVVKTQLHLWLGSFDESILVSWSQINALFVRFVVCN